MKFAIGTPVKIAGVSTHPRIPMRYFEKDRERIGQTGIIDDILDRNKFDLYPYWVKLDDGTFAWYAEVELEVIQ